MTLTDRVREQLRHRPSRDPRGDERYAQTMLGYATRPDHPWAKPSLNEARRPVEEPAAACAEQVFDGQFTG